MFTKTSNFKALLHSLKKSGSALGNVEKYTTVNPNCMVSLSKFSFFILTKPRCIKLIKNETTANEMRVVSDIILL